MADFVRAVATADIPDGKGRLWRHGDKRIALFRTPAEDNSTASIMVAHAVKTTTAAIAESAAGGRAPLAAAARFLAAPKRERFVYQATLDAIDFIQGRAKGDTPE